MIDPSHQARRTSERLASRRLIEHAIPHEGLRRPVLLYVPRHMLWRRRLPLVVVLHGGASNPETIARLSAMHRVAEREGFIVAYPAGTPGAAGLTWNPGEKGETRNTDDIRFVRKVIIDLQRRYDIDPSRIFAAGFSIGGSLVYELACLLPDRLAAVAVVSGTMTVSGIARPMPLIHVHGTNDRRVPLKGGRGPSTAKNNIWPPVQDGIDHWCRINGCASAPEVKRNGARGVTCFRYPGKADVELWVVEGGYHAWPGGLRDSAHAEAEPERAAGFSASEAIWSFFAARPKAGALSVPLGAVGQSTPRRLLVRRP